MLTITCPPKLTDGQADLLAGTFLGPEHFDTLVKQSTVGLRPDGSMLFAFIKGAIDPAVCKVSRDNLRKAARVSNNRGTAAGTLTDEEIAEFNRVNEKSGNRARFVREGQRMVRMLADGTKSKVTLAKPVESGIIGYFDRNSRNPYCRLTAFSLEHKAEYLKVMPLVKAVNDTFKQYAPERHAAQMEIVRKTHPDFVINDSAFTTITVNRNFRTACHKDAGDYKPGFGVLTALQTGRFSGGFFCIPKYRVAVDMRTTDVLLADVHEWHGNTGIIPGNDDWERISCVFYYREEMHECGSAVEERQRAASKFQV